MVACLEKSEGNVDFHEIILTNSQTVNDVKQIHATVDGKTIVISESSVNVCFHFNDEVICLATGQKFNFSKLIFNEPFNDTYETPKHTKKVFTNMKRKGKDFSGRVTPLFASMLAPPVVGGEGSGQPSEPQPPSSTTQPIIEEQIPTSVPIPNVADEAVFKERDDRVVRATTTAASLDATQASGNITKTQSTAMSNDPLSQEIGLGDRPMCQEAMRGEDIMEHQVDLTDFVSPTPHDSPLSGGHTPGSDEGRPNINELMAICTNLSNRVLAFEQSKTAQYLVINKLQKKVKRFEKALRERTLGMKLFKIGTSRRKGLDKENVSKQGRKSNKTKPMFKDSDFDVLDDPMENVEGGSTADQITIVGDTLNTASINVSTVEPSNGSAAGPSISTIEDIFDDEMTTITDTYMAIKSARPRTTSVLIHNVEEEQRRATPIPTVQSQDKGKEEQAQFEREQRIARERAAEQEAKDDALIEQMEDARFLVETIAARKKFFAAQRAAKIRNRPPTRTQLRNQMITYLKHMGNGKKDDSSSKQAKSSKKRPRAEHDEESVKKQKLQDDAEKEELRACLDIVQGDDIAIDVESLATKYPIVDWKTRILTQNMMYYQIIKADGSSKNYKIFSEMLDDFDRQDVMDLHRLMKSGGINKANLISWRLFDSCGVHVLLMDNGIAIHMMKEKKYPLTQEMLSRMLNRRLEVDHESEMAFDLLRFTRSQLKK
ncbi:hypothetical protein Tco_0002833 [Tanacetum coccineum]